MSLGLILLFLCGDSVLVCEEDNCGQIYIWLRFCCSQGIKAAGSQERRPVRMFKLCLTRRENDQ